MKPKNFSILVAIFCLFSFSQKEKDPKPLFDAIVLEKSMKLIPSGRLTLDLIYDKKTGIVTEYVKSDSIEPFYLMEHEISNLEYRNFTISIKKSHPEIYNHILPDTTVWNSNQIYYQPFVNYYFRHPAYNKYPVIGISYEQAIEYCKWLTENYSNTKKKKFKNVIFTLPSKNEWMMAASGGKYFNLNVANIQNKKGQWLANFRVFDQIGISREQDTTKNITDSPKLKIKYIATSSFNELATPVISYLPNTFGIYNMQGNVEEFVFEKGVSKGGSWNDPGYYLQNLSEETYDTTKSASVERGFRVAMKIIK